MIYTTFSDAVAAEKAARLLVDSRLAACVNMLPGMRSAYRWDGAVVVDDEVAVIIKTVCSRVEEVKRAITQVHSYDCPALVVLAIEDGLPAYLAWIADATSDTTSETKSDTQS